MARYRIIKYETDHNPIYEVWNEFDSCFDTAFQPLSFAIEKKRGLVNRDKQVRAIQQSKRKEGDK